MGGVTRLWRQTELGWHPSMTTYQQKAMAGQFPHRGGWIVRPILQNHCEIVQMDTLLRTPIVIRQH